MTVPAVPGKTRRGLSPDALAALGRPTRRALVQALAVEHGLTLVTVTERGHVTDVVLAVPVLAHPSSVLVRLTDEPWPDDAHDEAVGDAARAGCAAHLLVGGENDPAAVRQHPSYLPLPVLVKLVESSALVRWEAVEPAADAAAYAAWRQAAADLLRADATGLRWLPSLSLNKLPVELRSGGVDAETLFEEVAFRIGVRVLGLRGRLLGSERRGKREPDGFFADPNLESVALFDCKAARDGFEMSAAEERKLAEYARRRWTFQGASLPVCCVIVFSSSFPGGTARFHHRRQALRDAGADLAYVSASALFELALPLALSPDGPEAARLVDWTALLADGVVADASASAAAEVALAAARTVREADEAV